jgi:uncharacterized protein YciI
VQFLIIGLDGTDADAPDRRAAARPHHIEQGEKLRKAGHLWFGAALYDDQGNMNGSMYLVDFDDRQGLDEWLRSEPYVVGGVWENLDVRNANVRDPWQFTQPREFYEGRTTR